MREEGSHILMMAMDTAGNLACMQGIESLGSGKPQHAWHVK